MSNTARILSNANQRQKIKEDLQKSFASQDLSQALPTEKTKKPTVANKQSRLQKYLRQGGAAPGQTKRDSVLGQVAGKSSGIFTMMNRGSNVFADDKTPMLDVSTASGKKQDKQKGRSDLGSIIAHDSSRYNQPLKSQRVTANSQANQEILHQGGGQQIWKQEIESKTAHKQGLAGAGGLVATLNAARITQKQQNRDFFSKKTHARATSALPTHGKSSRSLNLGVGGRAQVGRQDPESFGQIRHKDRYGHPIEPNAGADGIARVSKKNVSQIFKEDPDYKEKPGKKIFAAKNAETEKSADMIHKGKRPSTASYTAQASTITLKHSVTPVQHGKPGERPSLGALTARETTGAAEQIRTGKRTVFETATRNSTSFDFGAGQGLQGQQQRMSIKERNNVTGMSMRKCFKGKTATSGNNTLSQYLNHNAMKAAEQDAKNNISPRKQAFAARTMASSDVFRPALKGGHGLRSPTAVGMDDYERGRVNGAHSSRFSNTQMVRPRDSVGMTIKYKDNQNTKWIGGDFVKSNEAKPKQVTEAAKQQIVDTANRKMKMNKHKEIYESNIF